MLTERMKSTERIENIVKSGIIISVLIVSLQVLGCSSGSADVTDKPLKIGAILPLTGPASVWGENIRNGMELARSDLLSNNVSIEIIYEDSRANPTLGLSAFRKLQGIDNVSIIFSAFSSVSVPLELTTK